MPIFILAHGVGMGGSTTTLQRQRTMVARVVVELTSGQVVRKRAERVSGSDSVYAVANASSLVIRGPLNG